MEKKLAIYHTHSHNPGYGMRDLSESLHEELVKRGINPENDIERLGPLFEIPRELLSKEVTNSVQEFFVDNICTSIEISNVVIALNAGNDPDVLWQMAYAYALGKPVIAVNTENMPEYTLARGSAIACIDHIFRPERLSILAAIVVVQKNQVDMVFEDDVVAY